MDVLRIILVESIKKTNTKPKIFNLVESLIDVEESFSITKRNGGYDRNERLVAEFFTNIIPVIAYLCFRDYGFVWIENSIPIQIMDHISRETYNLWRG